MPDPDPSRWQDQLKDVGRDQRRISLRLHYVVRISIGRIPMGPNALQFSERVLAILRGRPAAASGRAGIPAPHRHGERLHRGRDRRGGGAPPDGGAPPGDLAARQQAVDMARDYIASLPAGLFPTMTSLADEFALADPDERFEILLDTFVDGLARRAATGAQR